jgi:hypothetical protein
MIFTKGPSTIVQQMVNLQLSEEEFLGFTEGIMQ